VLKVNPEAGCAGGSGSSVEVAAGGGSGVGSTMAVDLPQAATVRDTAISSSGANCL